MNIFSKGRYCYLICSCIIWHLRTVSSSNVNETKKNSGHGTNFPMATTVAAVVGSSMLLSAFVLIMAFLFCCKSNMASEIVDPPEQSTSMMSLTDHTEMNNGKRVLENTAIRMHEIVTKGKSKITKIKLSRHQSDTEQLQQ